jgi:hypothetical protein
MTRYPTLNCFSQKTGRGQNAVCLHRFTAAFNDEKVHCCLLKTSPKQWHMSSSKQLPFSGVKQRRHCESSDSFSRSRVCALSRGVTSGIGNKIISVPAIRKKVTEELL